VFAEIADNFADSMATSSKCGFLSLVLAETSARWRESGATTSEPVSLNSE